jgi:hypothetical protein
MKTARIYSLLAPAPERFDDRGEAPLTAIPVERTTGKMWEAAVLGTPSTIQAVRITIPDIPTRRTVSLQSVGNLGAATASNIEGPTDLDWVGLCYETEISRCALDSCMAQERSNCLQIASAFQNVESLRPA